MRKVLHKVKSQWIVLGVLGATVVSLGTADVRQVSASEIEGASASETLTDRKLGTADVIVEATEKAAHIGLDHAISTATTDGTATVFVHWNEDGTITVTVKDLNGSVLYSDLLVDSEGENTIKVLTANQDYYTINIAVKAATTEQTTTATGPIEQAVPEVQAEVDATEEVAVKENNYAKIVSTTEVDYPAVIARATDAINTAPWGVQGYQTLASSADYAGKTVDVTKEQVTDYGVTWALVSLNGKELGWIAKDALTVQTYAAITSETVVDYPATIRRGTDAINLAPWGTKGYQTIASSAAYVGKTVDVIKEQTTDYGVTWAQISLNGEVLGWIAKDALAVQTYAAVVSETVVDYPATVNRNSDAINTAPWGVKGYQTLSSSAAYAGQTVEVIKEQVTDYGVTWAQISLNGEVLGWIAKDALRVQTFAQITKETDVDYSATISRDSDAINTAPWGVKGYQTLSSSAAFVGQTVEVTKEQTTDYGVTWALVSQNGKELGWIAKDALKVQTYAQITKETAVSYDAIVNRDSDAINTAPWGVKGFQTLSSSAAYVGQTVEVTKEQTTDYGVTWALVSQNGKELGWIAKDALKVQTYVQITKETTVNYAAIVNRDSDAINTAPWGVKGYQTLSSSAAYAGQTVEVTKEQTTDYGVTWALVSQNGKELGWIAKDALKVQTYAQIVSENEVAYPALINRGTDAINTSPWGTKGYQTNASSADYLGQTVEVAKEQTTDYGVTWSLVSLNGKELGWIAKDALTVMERTVETVVAKENTVAYQTVSEEDNTIPTGESQVAQAGADGYDTVTYDVTYVNGVETNRVEVNRTTTAPVNEIVKVGTQVTEVKTETTTENKVAFSTVEEEDNTIPTGERVVVKAGVNGYDTVTYDVTFVNGVETNRVEADRKTTAPVNEIIKVGTQVTEVKSETNVEKEIAYATVEQLDNTIPTGERVVVKAGAKGYDTVTYDVTYVNGIETNRAEISRATTAPVAEVVKVGTQVTEVKTETTTENEIAFATVEEADNTIPTGERVVVQAGENGYDSVTYEVTFVNGVETNRVEADRKTTAPVNEIIKVGTQVTEVKSEATTENEIAYATVEELDNTIPTGERVVVKTGAKGYDTVSYDVTYVNGIETNRVEVSRKTTAPVAEIVKVGTQVTEVKSETTTENEVAFATVEEFDNTIPTGERVGVQTGLKGYDTVEFDVTYVNGIETNRVEVSRATTASVSEIVKVGTQVTEVKSETTTENEVAYATVEEFDNTIPTGERILVQAGVKGYDTVSYDVTYVSGIETNRVETSRTTTAPVAEVVKVGTQVTEIRSESVHENAIQYGTQEQADANLFIGERQVIQQGSEGYDVVLYDVTYVNGVEASRTEISRETIAPVEEIVKVGTKQAIAQIGGFRIEELSVDASGVYEGYNSKNVVLRMTATSKNANITYAYVNYESANGYSDQLQFVNVGNNVFEATIPFSSYYTHAGLYQIGLIGASDSAGNTWVIFPEGRGSGLNYTSADLSAADFTIKETSGLASVAGVTLESVAINNPVVYVGEWSSNKVTMKVKSDGAPISSASITFTLPNGWDNSCDFVYVGNGTYEATVECFPKFYFAGAGSYGVESINIYDVNGNVFIFFPEGYGTGLNYDSGDLSGAYFEAINRPVVTTETIAEANPLPFETIYQDDPNLMVGETKVIQSGVFGNETQYYTVTYTDGIETARIWSHSELVSAPLAEIIAVGTKQPLAQIGGFTLKDLSVESDIAYAGDWEDSKKVTMKVSGTSATIQSAHFNYRLPSGGYGQEDFVYVGNDTYEVAVPTYFWGAGSYQTDSIFLIDSNGSSWVIMSEGNGAGMNYTSANLSASDFEVLPAIASVGGVTLISMDLEDNVIHEDDGTTNKLTIKLKDNDATISTVYISYTLPNGFTKRFDFVNVGNDIYEATINQPYFSYIVGAGSYKIESLYVGDVNGDYVIFFPEGNGSGQNYTSGNLSEGNFEVLATPKNTIETTTEPISFDTVYQDDSSMLIGETRVIQSGVAGTKTNYYNVTYYNGVETSREWTHSEVTTGPVNEVVAVGTKSELADTDTTKPIIDQASVKVSQTTATVGDTITISAKITDNVEVAKVQIVYMLTDSSMVYLDMTKNNDTGLYECVLPITDTLRAGLWNNFLLKAYDTSNNVTGSSTNNANFTIVDLI
ncbi:G5 domain-containing protein [Trichococcus paludicola]|uniref:G5 domain-containing protein n=1 Tax=Trichococcus paludicola TaxID=2052942 RepID=UPI00131C2BB8|nr:G5 domain-containing protein [Trichococcus paludicola]